ncbi:MAG: hypothetical protein GY853_16230 [PVC group bacterium]|nr:hypothetical protein [PVC group bacterium]
MVIKYKKRKNGLSTNYLISLWSKAVKCHWNYRCALCGRTDSLESHHIIKRNSNFILKLSIENGICLCGGCHSTADFIETRNKIEKMVDINYLTMIQCEYKLKKDYLLKKGITEKEYRSLKANEFKKIIKEYSG